MAVVVPLTILVELAKAEFSSDNISKVGDKYAGATVDPDVNEYVAFNFITYSTILIIG
jgi:hypothetical protein